ncbi:helix-hairpin-helix domain-containing protein [Arthrobacter sp. MDT1-65]
MGKHRWPTAGDPWEPPVHALDPPPSAARPGVGAFGTGQGLRRGRIREDDRREDDRREDDTGTGRKDGHSGAHDAHYGAGFGAAAGDDREDADEDGYAPRPGLSSGPARAPGAWAGPDEGFPSAHRGVQWKVARSAALVFLGVALAVGAALFLMRSSEPSAAALSVPLDAGGDSGADGGAPRGGAGEGSAVDRGAAVHGGAAVGGGEGPPGGAGSGTAPGNAQPADAPPGQVPAQGPGRGAGGDAIVVYVTGSVVSPGVVTVPAGTRLFEILEDVGGALPEADLEGINLAASPADGQHVHLLAVGEEPRPDQVDAEVPAPGGTAAGGTAGGTGGSGAAVGSTGGTGGTGGTGSPPGVLDINTATLADIEALPRVGPILGQRIIDWRDEHGPFAQPADIDAVPGIGPAILDGMLPLIVAR